MNFGVLGCSTLYFSSVFLSTSCLPIFNGHSVYSASLVCLRFWITVWIIPLAISQSVGGFWEFCLPCTHTHKKFSKFWAVPWVLFLTVVFLNIVYVSAFASPLCQPSPSPLVTVENLAYPLPIQRHTLEHLENISVKDIQT